MTEIKSTEVTWEEANLLKEKGFDAPCMGGWYQYLDRGLFYDDTGIDHEIERPEQWQVVEWLRIKHGIWILIDIDDIKHSLCNYVIKWYNGVCLNEARGNGYKTPKDAYSAAFDYVLKNLI